MPSNALNVHFEQLLKDVIDINTAHNKLKTGNPGRQHGLAALNRAAVVSAVSAWESYVEELMRESLQALRQAAPPLDPWPALSAYVLGFLARLNTPNSNNVSNLIHNSLGLPNVHLSWVWRGCTSNQAVDRLDAALDYRHKIAHGVKHRPGVLNDYSKSLLKFFRQLANCMDTAVRHHLVTSHGVSKPWPL